MARRKSDQPTQVELEILKALWGRGSCSLGEVYEVVNAQRPAARTTIATLLGVMLSKGLVKRESKDGGYRWSAAVSHGSAARGMTRKLIDAIFDGSAHRLVAHLIEQGRLSEQQMDEIEQLLQSARKSAKTSNKPKGKT